MFEQSPADPSYVRVYFISAMLIHWMSVAVMYYISTCDVCISGYGALVNDYLFVALMIKPVVDWC